jgi:arylamine N-acetyltransferase
MSAAWGFQIGGFAARVARTAKLRALAGHSVEWSPGDDRLRRRRRLPADRSHAQLHRRVRGEISACDDPGSLSLICSASDQFHPLSIVTGLIPSSPFRMDRLHTVSIGLPSDAD